MNEPCILIQHLHKSFGKTRPVLKDINIEVGEGQIVGLVGPNGCGKSTLFNILLGLLKADSGSVTVLGESDPDVYRASMGTALDEGNFDPQMSGLGNLKTTAAVKGLKQPDFMPLVKTFQMEQALSKNVGKYSFGMRKRLSLIAALMGRPQLLLLDEPNNGMDVSGNLLLRNLLTQLNSEGVTIFLTSHILSDLEKMCTHLILMRDREIICSGSTPEVIGAHSSLEETFIQKAL